MQETWLYIFEDKLILKTLSNSNCHTVSEMDERDVGRKGRPFGGCGIVWNNNLQANITPLMTKSQRFCAVTCIIDNVKCLFISVYMPVLSDSSESINKYCDILNEISSILFEYDDFKVVIGGDFNLDFKRDCNTGYYKILKDFLIVNSLVKHDELFSLTDNSFTYESCTGSRSYIDYLFFSENMCSIVNDFKCFNDGSNLSDHCPLYVDTCISQIRESQIDDNNNNENVRFCWDEVTDEHRSAYSDVLEVLLESLYLPESIINCKDYFCEIHRDIIVEFLNDIIEAINVATFLTIPVHSKNSKSSIVPGWNKYVKFYKEKSIFWNNVWKDADSPPHGQLAELRKFARKKYHDAINYVKKIRT